MFLRSALLVLAAVVSLNTGSARAAVIVDTGVILPHDVGLSLDAGQWVGARFAVSGPTVITDLEGYLSGAGGTLTLALRADAGGPGGELFASPFMATAQGWQRLNGLSWILPAGGSYWMTFEVRPGQTFSGSIGLPLAPIPYAAGTPPADPWELGEPPFGAAVRAHGTAAPEPGAWALMILGFAAAGVALRGRIAAAGVSRRRSRGVRRMLVATGLVASAMAGPAAGAAILDTGVQLPFVGGLGVGPGPHAVRFEVAAPTRLTEVEAYLVFGEPGATLTFAVRDEDAGAPGAERFSAGFEAPHRSAWQGLSDLSWVVPAGAYWASLEVRPGQTFDGGIGRALEPARTLFRTLPDSPWRDPTTDAGAFRIEGTTVPEPAVWALMISGFAAAAAALRRRARGDAHA